jgi:hypothetical protein
MRKKNKQRQRSLQKGTRKQTMKNGSGLKYSRRTLNKSQEP